MTTKRPDSFEEFQRKRREKLAPSPGDNYPDLPSLSHEEITYVEPAREALATIKRTFEFWMVIARGLKALRDKADRIGGRFTFDRLREREGLGGRNKRHKQILDKTRVSRLLGILDHIKEVEVWRAGLTDKERFEWASPEAVCRHCPVFAGHPDDGEKPPSPYAQLKATNIELQEQLNTALKREDGDTFNPKTSSPREIAVALYGQLKPYRGKAKKVVHEFVATLSDSEWEKLKGEEDRRRERAIAMTPTERPPQ